jgi:hypothetical protein
MAEETLALVPVGTLTGKRVNYLVRYTGSQVVRSGIRYRLGMNAGAPVVVKTVAPQAGAAQAGMLRERLRREVAVSAGLRGRGGEWLGECLASDDPAHPSLTLANFSGTRLTDLIRDDASWPLRHAARMKAIRDLIQGLNVLQVSCVVHGAIGLDTLYWNGSTLQINDFGLASQEGMHPDGSPASHAEDIIAAGRVIYHVYTGQPPPIDPADLRLQVKELQGPWLRDLMFLRDPASRDERYVFSPDPATRPTAQAMLAQLTGPHGIQAATIAKRDQQVRDSFRALRQEQAHSRAAYFAWKRQPRVRATEAVRTILAPARPTPGPTGYQGQGPAPAGSLQPTGNGGMPAMLLRPGVVRWLVITAAAATCLLVLALLGVL